MTKNQRMSKYEEKILSLSRHFVWADKMKWQFGEALTKEGVPKYIDNNWYVSDTFMYMALWYALLFEIIEALHKWNIKIPDIQEKIDKYYNMLGCFRNAVFHIKGEFHSKDFYKIIDKGEKSAGDIREINDKTGAFLERLIKRTKKSPIWFVSPTPPGKNPKNF